MSSMTIILPAHELPPPSPTAFERCVLVLEDDRTTQMLLAGGLRRAGYKVKTATRLSDARAIMKEGGVDLLITDGLLPDGSGYEFIKEVRSGDTELPILFLSAFFKDMRSFQSLKKDLGVDGVLHKPVALLDLLGRVAEALSDA